MKQFCSPAQVNNPSLSSDGQRIIVMFRDLLTLFMRIIATKNDELSVLRNQHSYPYDDLVLQLAICDLRVLGVTIFKWHYSGYTI